MIQKRDQRELCKITLIIAVKMNFVISDKLFLKKKLGEQRYRTHNWHFSFWLRLVNLIATFSIS